MKKYLSLLLFLSLTLLGRGQTARIDSLRQQLLGAPDTLLMGLYADLAKEFSNAEAWDSCLVYSTKLEALARQAQDTTHLIIAYDRQSRSHFGLGDSLQGNPIREKQLELRSTYGVRLDNPFNYNYSLIEAYNYTRLYFYNTLTILCDSSGTLSYEEVREKAFSSNNSRGNLEQDRVYWMQVRIVASRDRYGDQYFSIGGGVFSWKEIDVYYEQSDTLIHLKTGLDLLAKDKAIRDAFNWIKVSLQPLEEIRLFVRVKGRNVSPYISKPLSIYHLKIKDCLELEGYRFQGHYTNPSSSIIAYNHNFLSRSIEIMEDSSASYTLETVQAVWDAKARFNDWRGFDPEKVYWVKMRLLGSDEFYGQQLFSVGDAYLWGWNKVDVYTPNPKGGYNHQRTGNDLPLWKKYRGHKMNLFTVDIGAKDTVEVYLRLEDSNKRYALPSVYFYHYDQASFWNQYQFFTGGTFLFYGIMLSSVLFFFLFFLISRKWVYVYFSLTYLSYLLFICFTQVAEFYPFPFLLEHAFSLSDFFFGLAMIFILLFTQDFLDLRQWHIRFQFLIPTLVILILLIKLILLSIFYTIGYGELLSKAGVLSGIIAALAMCSMIFLSILAIRKGNKSAWFFLVTILIAASVTVFINLSGLLNIGVRSLMGKQQIYLLLGLTTGPIFIALALGFRSRQQDRQTQAAMAAEAKAKAEKEAAQLANETKSNFLSTVSHELRTPLTSVLGFAKIIRKRFTERVKPALSVEDPKLNRTVDQIEKNLDVVVLEGERLTNLINDVLDLAKIESGRTDWHLEPIDLNVLVHQAYLSTSSLFEGKQLEYKEELAPELPTVTGDHDKLVQVMINLLSNAVKFTDEGSVTVSTRLEKDQIIVGVRDTGIGIAQEDMPKVFEKFRQVGDTLTDKPKGTGLGLPICQEIIEYLGGEIWVDSKSGEGSLFAYSLPLKEKDRPLKGTTKMEELIEELKKKMSLSSVMMPQKPDPNILVVDDEPSIRELLRQELTDTGYRVTLAKDGKQALQKVREQRPDMIILDVMMPELNGFDLAAILKNDPKTVNIPILILSIVQDQERGYRIGVDRYLHKPIDTDLLLQEVETLLSNGSSTKKVLVIDENQSTVATMASVLSAKGFEVVEADEADLIEVARSSMPDVIILNAALNEREQIMRALRFEKGLESVLIIMYQ